MAAILITGASRGIGRALAERYAARGDRVFAVLRDRAGLEKVGGPTPGVAYFEADVTDDAALARVAASVGDALDGAGLDLLIANAGRLVGRAGVSDPENTRENWLETLMTNVYGPFATVRAALPLLERAEAPKIAVLGSIMASSEFAIQKGNSYSYRASKAAAVNLSRNLAGELKPRGVAVGAYHPGWVRTDMGGSAADISVDESADGLVQRFDALSMATTGVFEDYRGEKMPF